VTHSLDGDDWRPWPVAMDVSAVDMDNADVRILIQGCHDDACYYAFAYRGDELLAFTKSLSVARAYERLLTSVRGSYE
jgi:hypothetical protein